MSDNKTANLIEQLVEGHCPIQCTRHPLSCSTGALLASVFYVAAVALFVGVRPDIGIAFQTPQFLFEVMTVAMIAVSAALASAWLRVPDMRGHHWMVAVPLTLLGSFLLWSGLRIFDEGFALGAFDWHHCAQDALLMAVIPVVAIVAIARQGNTVRPLLMAFMNILSVSAIGYVGLRFTCSADTLDHIGPFHILPYIVIGVVMGVAAKRLYKW